jgi:hypothetical protein
VKGIDRTAVNTAVEILESAERPLVIFPEGIVSRTNDKLNDFLEGTALIARLAAKKRAKLQPPRKVVVHPLAIRYRLQGDVEPAISGVLDEIETRLTWRKNDRNLPLVERIYKTGSALLTLKELEYLGQAQRRRHRAAVGQSHRRHPRSTGNSSGWTKKQDGSVPTRVKRLANRDPAGHDRRSDRRNRTPASLDTACRSLPRPAVIFFPPDYMRSDPTPERLLETVERFEEDLTDLVRVHGRLHATITVGEAIEVSPAREGRGGDDPLMEQIKKQLKEMLGLETRS